MRGGGKKRLLAPSRHTHHDELQVQRIEDARESPLEGPQTRLAGYAARGVPADSVSTTTRIHGGDCTVPRVLLRRF